MADRKGILLNTSFDLSINPRTDINGIITSGMVVNDTLDQEVAMILKLNPGEHKENPLLGAGLNKFIRGKNTLAIEQRIRQQLSRAGIDYNEYKDKIQTTINNQE